jgi:hypothetical protein
MRSVSIHFSGTTIVLILIATSTCPYPVPKPKSDWNSTTTK